ncbi:MAG TPA: hypothetical protein VMD77_02225 [Candidatus Baltobacteraceae bacterium]|nr:hypothetical protein [Verrucomicrobiae bacterium]HTX14083.1 hypothetical protein [Candidatus Baltobacteraceae bacterium]
MKARAALLAFAILAPALLGGCAGAIRSVSGFYTKNDVTYDPGLIGRWKPVRPKPQKLKGNELQLEIPVTEEPMWGGSEADFEPAAGQPSSSESAGDGYNVSLRVPSSSHLTIEFKVHLFHLGDSQFLDEELDTVRSKGEGLNIQFFAIPTHLLEKVERRGNTLYLYPLSYDWFRRGFADNTLSFPHSKDDNGALFLVADTASLQEFVVKHADDRDVFGPEARLERKKSFW